MGRNKKPKHLKLINGSAKKHPERHKDDHLNPKPRLGIGKPPTSLDDELKAIWSELEKVCADGVLAKSDRLAFEMLCRTIRAIRNSDTFVSSQYTQFVSLASKFGLSPSDRQNIHLPHQKERSPFDDC